MSKTVEVFQAVFVCLMTATVWLLPPGREPLLADAELGLYRPWRSACGPVSVYLAIKELGRSASLAHILEHVPVEGNGTSLASLCAYLGTCGIEYQAVRTLHVEPVMKVLSPGRSCAIVSVDQGTHFVLAKCTRSGQIVVLDGHEIVSDRALDSLQLRFSGAVVVVGDDIARALCALPMWIRVGILVGAYILGSITGMVLATRNGCQTVRKEDWHAFV